MTYIGIDPGKSGCLAVLDGDGAVRTFPFDLTVYVEELSRIDEKQAFCCLEHVASMPKQGVASTFTFGENFGQIQGILLALRIPFELVRPQKWKKAFSITADKNTSVEVCRRLYPEASLKRTERSRKDDDNTAEAILLAEYARRTALR